MALRQVFVRNMRNSRKRLGLTQEKLAEKCNTDACYIRQIEIGRRFPSIEYIERIAEALNIAPFRLFVDTPDMESEKCMEQQNEQKQKIKSMLMENMTQIFAMIDEQDK